MHKLLGHLSLQLFASQSIKGYILSFQRDWLRSNGHFYCFVAFRSFKCFIGGIKKPKILDMVDCWFGFWPYWANRLFLC